MSDSVVAEADLMTLLSGREEEEDVVVVVGGANGVTGVAGVTGASADSRRWRARRAAKSLMALVLEGASLPEAAGGGDRKWRQQGDPDRSVTFDL